VSVDLYDDTITYETEPPVPVEIVVDTTPADPIVEVMGGGCDPVDVLLEAAVFVIDQRTVIGDGDARTVTAAANLSGHRAVKLSAPGAVYADSHTVADAGRTIGITTGAAANGTSVTVQTAGPLTESSWSWTPAAPIYVGANGALTQTVPAVGNGARFSQRVGYAVTPTEMFVDLGPDPIILS
jgi:hypothetical protein